ncbi:MAG TPA: calcium-binding protein, partial [Solirubrobacteraceae bacterium]
GADELRGGADSDLADYSDRGTTNLKVSLENAANDGASGEGDNVRSDVENVTTAGGDDVITGSGSANTLRGGAGDDRLDGGFGADRLFGGDDVDTVTYASHGLVGVVVDLAGTGADDGTPGEHDTLATDVENVTGTAGDDELDGDAGGNVLSGGGGDDVLDGRLGADALAGGDGFDLADYSLRSADLAITLDGVADDGASGEKDDVGIDVEDVATGSGDDAISGSGDVDNFFYGGGGVDALNGGPGDDILLGGAGDDNHRGASHGGLNGQTGDDILDGGTGADDLNGSTGSDTADYSSRTAALDVTIDGAADDGAAGEGDNVAADVENVVGGSGDDDIAGSSAANTLVGGDGADTLSGRAGPDTIISRDAFADMVECGGEDDRVIADLLDGVDADCETVSFPSQDGGGTVELPSQGGQTDSTSSTEQTGQSEQIGQGTTQPTTTDQTPSASKPARVRPTSLSVRVAPGRDRSAPFRFVVTGVVGLPPGTSRTAACQSGRVSVQVKVGTKTISTRRAAVDFTCHYRLTLSFANARRLGRGRLKIVVRFLGTTRLTALGPSSRFVRAG